MGISVMTLDARACFTAVLGVSAFVLASVSCVPPSYGQGAEPQYLMFQIFTAGPGFTTEVGRQAITALPDPGFLDGEARKILEVVGTRGDDLHRLGIMVGPLALDHDDGQLRALIERTFAIASKYKIAVGLHIDDSKFWMNRRDLWSNGANVEWPDWKGPPNSGQYLNWGRPWKLAPQACFNSAAMLREARRLTAEVIGPAVAAQIAKLRATGDEALFAGIIVGWETAIGQEFGSRKDLGFCALGNLGFSRSAPPPDPDSRLEAVVQGWIETWAKGLADAGVPQARIYSHVAFISRKQYEDSRGSYGRSYSRTVMYTPPEVAFGNTHRPGFTTYPDVEIFRDIYAALEGHGSPPWASAEGTNVDIQTAPPAIPAEGMQDYLARMFNHGATMANVFGWGIGERDNLFRRATEGDEAVAAYRKFLLGSRLEEKPLGESYRSGLSVLQRLMRGLRGRIESYRRAGGDPAALQPRLSRLEEDMKAGRLDAMRRELDQIEATIDARLGGSGAQAAGGFDIAALQQQMRALPQRLDAFQRRGGDMRRVKDRVESIQRHIAAGELEKAFAERQALDPILGPP